MSVVLSHLSEFPEPQASEQTALLLLDSDPQTGYRIKAFCAETGRVLGRFMSDCPLSVCQSALLWVSTHQWQIAEADGSLGVQRVLDQVERPTPLEPPGGIHVRQVVRLIMENMPPETGAVQPQPSPIQLQGRGPRQLPGPVQGQEEPPRRRRRRREPEPEMDPELAEVDEFLKEARRALRRGADPAEVSLAVQEFFGSTDGEDDPQIARQPAPAHARQPAPAHARQPAHPNGYAGAPAHLAPRPDGFRPLQDGEIPPNLTPDQQAEFEALTAGTDHARRKIEQGIRFDQDKYLQHVPPLTAEQQAEIEAWRAEKAAQAQATQAAQAQAAQAAQAQAAAAAAAAQAGYVVGEIYQGDDGHLYQFGADHQFHRLSEEQEAELIAAAQAEAAAGDLIDADDPDEDALAAALSQPINGQAHEVANSGSRAGRGGGKRRPSDTGKGGGRRKPKGGQPAAEA